MLGLLLLVLPAQSLSLDELLARGEVTLLETLPDGRLRRVTAISRLPVAPDVVWARLTDWAAYKGWMPQVAASNLVSLEGEVAVVDWTIAVVGPNVSFRARYEMDPVKRVIHGEQVSGALSGSVWDWSLTAEPGGTLVERCIKSNVVESNWIVRQVEDSNHTMDYGINVATAVVEQRGLRNALTRP